MAEPCSSTALAIVLADALMFSIVLVMLRIELVVSWVELLNARDLAGDLGGGLGGLLGQRLDLLGDDGEPAPRLSRSRRLDGGVERQHVGLGRYVVDQRDDIADPLDHLVELLHRHVVCSASLAASWATLLDWCTCWEISRMEQESSSVALATVCTFADVSSEAAATALDWLVVRPADWVRFSAVALSSVDAAATTSTMPPMALLEVVGQLEHIRLALFGGAALGLLLVGLHLLDLEQVLLEDVGGAGVVPDFVATAHIRNRHGLVAVGQLHQHVADAADGLGNPVANDVRQHGPADERDDREDQNEGRAAADQMGCVLLRADALPQFRSP